MSGSCVPHGAAARAGGQDFHRRASGVLAAAVCLLVFAGCTTAHRAPPSLPRTLSPAASPVEAPRQQAAPPLVAPAVAPPPVPPVVPPNASPSETPRTEVPPTPTVILLIESVPPGAIVVVDGRPVGKAPVRVPVPDTPQGFFRDYMEIRARFLATDPTGDSRTAMEEFTPREKVPAVLHFTPDGAQRTAR